MAPRDPERNDATAGTMIDQGADWISICHGITGQGAILAAAQADTMLRASG